MKRVLNIRTRILSSWQKTIDAPCRRLGWIALVCAFGSLSAIEVMGGLRDHVQKSVGDQGYVDWTAGYISAKAIVPIGDIRSGGGLTRVRDEATEAAREAALSRVMNILSRLMINGDRTILSEMRANEDLAVRLGAVSELAVEKSRRVDEGKVTVELVLQFYGKRGLFSRLAPERGEEIPEVTHNNPRDEITGLLIDATDANVEFVLEPRILTDQGRLIYGPGQADRSCFASRGLASYHMSRDAARKDRRIGDNPYLLYASTRAGAAGDLFISSQDAIRILGSKTGRAALKGCAVAIVVDSPRGRHESPTEQER